jgi:hypothetical protein
MLFNALVWLFECRVLEWDSEGWNFEGWFEKCWGHLYCIRPLTSAVELDHADRPGQASPQGCLYASARPSRKLTKTVAYRWKQPEVIFTDICQHNSQEPYDDRQDPLRMNPSHM